MLYGIDIPFKRSNAKKETVERGRGKGERGRDRERKKEREGDRDRDEGNTVMKKKDNKRESSFVG